MPTLLKATFHLPLNPFLQGCGLPSAWARQNAWRILDTEWQDGERFLACVEGWNHDTLRPRMLHYVALMRPGGSVRRGSIASFCQSLSSDFQDLQAGFNRLSFCNGRVLLTLCVGELKPMLLAQSFVADSLFLPELEHAAWDNWALQALLRCCRTGTELAYSSAQPGSREVLTKYGFEVQGAFDSTVTRARFNPHWRSKSSRRPFATPAPAPSSCVVIGAGLAGASTAASLARRGWQVQVLDAGAAPACEASGVPVGLTVPPPSNDTSPRSHLLRAGVKLSVQQAREHLVHGKDWAHTGVMTLKPGCPPQWLPGAAWIKPGRLVQAWLAEPGVHFRGNLKVASLLRNADEWLVRDAQSAVLARASLVVLAAPSACVTLLSGHGLTLRGSLKAFRGQVSWAHQGASDDARLPEHPLNGSGHLVPHVPVNEGTAWFTGATYLSDEDAPQKVHDQHIANMSRLADLHPGAAHIGAERLFDGGLHAWQSTRFTTQDRMPMVGPLDDQPTSPSTARLWINTGFGSRGLSWSVLCAELLAARLSAEPLPIPGAWNKLIDCGQ